MAKVGHNRQCIAQLVAGDDLGSHLPDPPCVIVQRVDNRGLSGIVPGPQQPSGRPDTKPVLRAARLAGQYPSCWRAAEREDQRRISVAAPEEVDAPNDDCAVAAAGALGLDALSWSLPPPRCGRHPAHLAVAAGPAEWMGVARSLHTLLAKKATYLPSHSGILLRDGPM